MAELDKMLLKLGAAIETGGQGRLLRALQVAAFKKNAINKISTALQHVPGGFVADWAMKDVLKIKKN